MMNNFKTLGDGSQTTPQAAVALKVLNRIVFSSAKFQSPIGSSAEFKQAQNYSKLNSKKTLHLAVAIKYNTWPERSSTVLHCSQLCWDR